MVIIPVAVENVGFPEKSQKSRDTKCLRDSEKSFIELPDAKQFSEIAVSEFLNSHLCFRQLSRNTLIYDYRINQALLRCGDSRLESAAVPVRMADRSECF
jgi:hypothetical protein